MNGGNMTLEKAKQIIAEAGYEPSKGGSWEDGRTIYASSVQSDRRCYNHPMFEVQYSKESGWLSVTGRKPERLV